MNKFLWSCAALLTVFVTVESLTCYTCDVTVFGSCLISSPVNCTERQDRCYSAVAKFSADDLLPIYARGCVESTSCKNETNKPLLTVNYTITTHCCSTNLCNGAAPIQLPLTAALAAALVALWSQWGL